MFCCKDITYEVFIFYSDIQGYISVLNFTSLESVSTGNLQAGHLLCEAHRQSAIPRLGLQCWAHLCYITASLCWSCLSILTDGLWIEAEVVPHFLP